MVCHELAHADHDHSYRSAPGAKGPGDPEYDAADEAQAQREEIYLNRYHKGIA
jgi:hypothetical protein